MSMTLTATDFGTLNQAVAATSAIQRQLNTLSQETSSGYLSPDYAGLGQAAAPALNLSAEISTDSALQTNMSYAGSIQQAAQTALGQIETIASNFATQATTLESSSGATSNGIIAASAQDALTQVAQLLNTQVGDVYVFAGQDSNTPPIPNANAITQSSFYTAIQTAISNLATNGAAATTASTLAIASPGGTSPFSASLEAAPAQSSVDAGGTTRITLAPLANTNSNVTSSGTGTTSTGSYTRDILLGLATLGSLGNTSPSTTGFQTLVQSTVTTLQGAVTAINTDIGALGDRQDQITAAESESSDSVTALKTQLGAVQDADLADVASQLASAQTQLQASYQLISQLGTLSLARYLPAA